jgi:hypothetical protein
MKSKKAQMSLGDAPMVVMIVGLTFLILATIALVSEKYQDALPSGETATAINETISTVTEVPTTLANSVQINFKSLVVNHCLNVSTEGVIDPANYTVGADSISFKGADLNYNNTDWLCTYTYAYTGIAGNITTDLNTEISNNTSIAGIVLTISLVGIVLTVLIGIFIGIRKGI